MRYISVETKVLRGCVPKISYLEINELGEEIRKIEFYEDDTIGYAYQDIEVGYTIAGDQIIPSIEEINKDNDFIAKPITKDYFEMLWIKYVQCFE